MPKSHNWKSKILASKDGLAHKIRSESSHTPKLAYAQTFLCLWHVCKSLKNGFENFKWHFEAFKGRKVEIFLVHNHLHTYKEPFAFVSYVPVLIAKEITRYKEMGSICVLYI